MYDYRRLIELELEKRIARNPSYSLRAFARDVSISPSRLSEVLKNKNGLSLKNASIIAHELKLNDKEKDYFITSVRSQHARSAREKKEALAKLNLLEKKIPVKKIKTDESKIISNWHHLAILELFNLRNFKLNIKYVQDNLNIPKEAALDAIKRLKKLEWIRNINSEWITEEAFRSFTSQVPSEAIRNYHKSIIKEATNAIDKQTIHERNLQSLILSISKEQIPEAFAELEKFCIDFNQKYSAQKNNGEKIYALAIQFFNLGKN